MHRWHDRRWLHQGHRQDVDGDCPERAGHHQFRDADQDCLLESHPYAAGHAAGGEQDHRSGRLPGSRADEDVRGHGLLPGGSPRPLPHGRGAQPRDREGVAWLGASANQHSARLLDAHHRHRAAADYSPGAPRGGRGCRQAGGEATVRGSVPGHPQWRWCGARGRNCGQRAFGRGARRPGLLQLPAQRRLPEFPSLAAGPLGYNGSRRRWS